jgi:ribosomal-protein-alanine N-acetyltransferase
MSTNETLTGLPLPEVVELPEFSDIYLRLTQPEDAEEWHRVISQDKSPTLAQYQYWTDDFTLENVKKRINQMRTDMADGKAMQYKILHREGDHEDLVGEVGIYRYGEDPLTGNLGYLITQDYEGKGIVSASARRILGLSRDVWGLQKVNLGIEEGNVRSENLATKLGAQLTDKVEKDTEADGRSHTLRVWEIVNE